MGRATAIRATARCWWLRRDRANQNHEQRRSRRELTRRPRRAAPRRAQAPAKWDSDARGSEARRLGHGEGGAAGTDGNPNSPELAESTPRRGTRR